MGSFCQNHIKFHLKKYRRVISHDIGEFSLQHSKVWKLMFQVENFRGIMCHDTEEWYKIWRKTELWFEKNYTRNLANFHASRQKSENLHFDWIVLSKEHKDLAEKIQKSYVSWHWRVMKSLKENWLLVPKKTWGICWNFTQLHKSPRISLWSAIFVQGIWGLSCRTSEELPFMKLNSHGKFV